MRAELLHDCGRSPTRPCSPVDGHRDGGGEHDRQADRRRREADAQRPRAREQCRQPDAAEHADDRRGGGLEARQAREVEQRHRRDESDPCQRPGGERPRHPPLARGDERQRPGQRKRHPDRPPERLARVARPAPRAIGAPAARAEQVGGQPEGGDRERQRDGERSRTRLRAPRPGRVEHERRPRLRAHERSQRTEHERGPDAAAQRSPHRAKDERHEQRLGHPAGGLAPPHRHVVEEQRERERRERGGGDSQPPRSLRGQVVGELGGEHEREQPRRPHEHEPQLRGGVAGQRQRRGDHDRQRLPRGPARRVELESGQLATPDQP